MHLQSDPVELHESTDWGRTCFAGLLSTAVVVEQHAGAPVGSLFEEEAAIVADAIFRRRMEFACGRECARRALARLGHPPVPIGTGAMRQPLWPAGVLGSITHCEDFCAAAVASVSLVQALGIDVERNAPMDDDIFARVSTPREREHVAELSEGGDAIWRVLLFSAKESLYKAWYPWTRCWLDFAQANVTFSPSRLCFEIEVTHPDLAMHGFPSCITGRYRWNKAHVFTGVEIAAGER